MMLRLLRRRPRTGDVGAALTVPEELTDCIDSFELLLLCCTLGGACVAMGFVGLTARRVKGFVTVGAAALGWPNARLLVSMSSRARVSRSSCVNLIGRVTGWLAACVLLPGDGGGRPCSLARSVLVDA